MRDVAIVGVGMTPVGEHWGTGLRALAADAIHAAMQDAGVGQADALYVGNGYGATLSSQTHVGALVADYAGLTGIEAFSVEAAEASGGAALRAGYLAVASGLLDTVIVAGVEKSADAVGPARTTARSVSLDADFESVQGVTLPALAALIMRRYMHEFAVGLEAFEGFSINAHANGKLNKNAMFRNTVRAGAFAKAPMVSDPVNLFDGAPDADGAAAVVLSAMDRVAAKPPVYIRGSAVATDTLALQDRTDPLHLAAVARSTALALQQAEVTREQINLFELHDAFTILSVLTLEAAGFAERGQGWQWAKDDGAALGLSGRLPISTFGGLKSRGNPAGATGVYQVVEAALQLRGEAGANQVTNARHALVQNLGGLATTVVTHVLSVA